MDGECRMHGRDWKGIQHFSLKLLKEETYALMGE
jgi:hypothetical protein